MADAELNKTKRMIDGGAIHVGEAEEIQGI